MTASSSAIAFSSTHTAANPLIGTEGVIEVGVLPDGPVLRVRRKGASGWEVIDTGGETLHGPNFIHRALADVIDALRTGREPELSARKALNATEIIFACYESSRRRGRVDLPLTIDDNPLQAMVESGELRSEPAAHSRFSPALSISTISAIRRLRVSGRRALSIQRM